MCVDSNFMLLITMPNYCISHTIIGKFFRNRIIRLLDACIFNVRSCKKTENKKPLLFDYRNLYSYQRYMRIPASTSCQHLVLSDSLIFVGLIYSMNLHFPDFQCNKAPCCMPIFHTKVTFTYTYTLPFFPWIIFIEIWEYLC